MYSPRSTEPRGKQLENKGMRGGKCTCIPGGKEGDAGDAFWPLILMLSLGLKMEVQTDSATYCLHTEELSRNQKIEITSANYAGRNWKKNPSRIGRSGGITIFFNRGRNEVEGNGGAPPVRYSFPPVSE